MSESSARSATPIVVESANGLRAIDLVAVENTRVGLKVAGIGILVVLVTIPGAGPFGSSAAILRALGWLVLGAGVAASAATPNGPLPRWLKRVYVGLCVIAAARILEHLIEPRVALAQSQVWRRAEQALVVLVVIAFLALPWILWRFCQSRGLIGRALTWLWSGILLLALFAAHAASGAAWLVLAYPLVGLLLLVICRRTARDVWIDAVNRQSKTVLRR